jgi:hypothetical protein
MFKKHPPEVFDIPKQEQICLMHRKGALVFNYLGHGGEDGLSAERIWEKSDGQNLSNQYKYPIHNHHLRILPF